MCELFGLSSNKVVGVSFSWRGFRRRGRIHRDGWGVAWYIGDGLAGLAKEPRPAPDSPIARLMVRGVRSKIVVSHVRWASQGEASYVNTHPFVRRLWRRDWVFAHNGDVTGIVEAPGYRLRRCRPAGETDSEYAFCYIIESLARLQSPDIDEVAGLLWRLAAGIGEYGKFNFLLSDGRYLFAHMNVEGTLHYLIRRPPHVGVASLLDEDYEVRLEELKAPDEYASIIATEPLTGEHWTPMTPGTLYAFRNGDLLLKVNDGEPALVLDRLEREVLKTIRTAPHSVKLEDVAGELGLELEEVARAVGRLRNKGLVKQHSKDTVPPNHPEACYYTNEDLRALIDEAIPT